MKSTDSITGLCLSPAALSPCPGNNSPEFSRIVVHTTLNGNTEMGLPYAVYFSGKTWFSRFIHLLYDLESTPATQPQSQPLFPLISFHIPWPINLRLSLLSQTGRITQMKEEKNSIPTPIPTQAAKPVSFQISGMTFNQIQRQRVSRVRLKLYRREQARSISRIFVTHLRCREWRR